MKESSVTILLGIIFIVLAAMVGSWKHENYEMKADEVQAKLNMIQQLAQSSK